MSDAVRKPRKKHLKASGYRHREALDEQAYRFRSNRTWADGCTEVIVRVTERESNGQLIVNIEVVGGSVLIRKDGKDLE